MSHIRKTERGFLRSLCSISIIEVWRFGRAELLDHDVDVADLNHGGT